MHDPARPEIARLDARVTELEILITHLQHTLDQLQDVVLRQGGETTRLAERLAGIQAQYAALTAPPQDRDPSVERPPHY